LSTASRPGELPAEYAERRAWLHEYFDRTAVRAWAQLTSDAPVSGIRRTVRAGRDRMRETLLSYLPVKLKGMRVLDAGCGTGALAVALSWRGAEVVATDLSPTLVKLAEERAHESQLPVPIHWVAGDMLDPALGTFDYVVAMDSLIHYPAPALLAALGTLAGRTRRGMVVTFAPRTPLLSTMWVVGRFFPRADRAPRIEPIAEGAIRAGVAGSAAFADWRVGRTRRIVNGFYTSQALELVGPGAGA
jgi:magnesium-protoporphyrin O-methyltransferase